MQEALVRSEIIGMDPSHLQLAIDHELVAKEEIFNVLGVDWITGHFATAMGSTVDPSLSYVLGGHTVHEVMDIMEGLFEPSDIVGALSDDWINGDEIQDSLDRETVIEWLELNL